MAVVAGTVSKISSIPRSQAYSYPFTSADITTTSADLTDAIDVRGATQIAFSVTSTDDTSGTGLKVEVLYSLDGTNFQTPGGELSTSDLVVDVDETGTKNIDATDYDGGYIKLSGKTVSGTVDTTAIVVVEKSF